MEPLVKDKRGLSARSDPNEYFEAVMEGDKWINCTLLI